MKMVKLTSLIASALVLSACGGSGGGGGSSVPAEKPESINKPTQSTNQAGTQGLSNENVAQPKESANLEAQNNKDQKQGEVQQNNPTIIPPEDSKLTVIEKRQFPKGKVENEDVGFGKVTGYNNKYSFNGAWLEKKDKNELQEIVVDGITIKLAKAVANKVGGLVGYVMANAFKSAWNVANDDGSHRDVFYFGLDTPVSVVDNLKGRAVYQGNATRYDNIEKSLANVGTSTLHADFDTKKISGELAMNGLRRNISLKETDIKGNGFEGKAVTGENSLFTTREGRYEGKFFGPNAEEVAGVARFEGEAYIGKLEDLNTSFSAEKKGQ